jgi:chalcone isomerase-like protein
MRKSAMLLTVALFALTPILALYAGTLSGVTLPDTVQVGSTTLTLNGLGLRTKYAFKVYVAGLYVTQKSSDPQTILKADAPKRLVMHFVRNLSKSQLTEGFAESFENNTPDVVKTLHPEIDRFFSALDSVKEGEEIILTYVPATGTSIAVAGSEKVTIAGPAFGEMLFSVWLGPKPPNAALKKGILGQ